MIKVSVIIVTHDSEAFLSKAIACLQAQTIKPHQVLLVDTGSKDLTYLEPYNQIENYQVLHAGNEVGFCRGNNFGYRYLSECDYLILLNPDAYLTPTFIEGAISFMEEPSHASVGMLSGKLLGFDNKKERPSGKYDSTGIFRTFWGRWYDRGQGEAVQEDAYNQIEYVKAICGALMFIRGSALKEVLLKGEFIFDESFYMYKEDIDLCLRMQKKGWKMAYVPELIAYHCRGWDPDRKKMARKFRLISAKNEFIIHFRMRSVLGMGYSLLKYLTVVIFNV